MSNTITPVQPEARTELRDRHARALPRPRRRARPDQHLLPRGPRRAARSRVPRRRRAAELGGWGYDLADHGRQPAPAGALRTGDGTGDDDAHVLGRHRRRARAVGRHVAALDPRGRARRRGDRRRPRRDRQRHPGPALDVPGRARRRRLRADRPQAVRLERAGVDDGSAPTPWTPTPPAVRRSCTPSSSAPAPASRSSRRGTRSACARRRATTPCSTACSCPTPASGAWSPPATAAIRCSWRWRCGRCR